MTEHAGPKSSGRKSGFYGYRAEAKDICKTARRHRDQEEIEEQLLRVNYSCRAAKVIVAEQQLRDADPCSPCEMRAPA